MNNHYKLLVIIFLTTFLLLGNFSVTSAAFNKQINIQGRLTDSFGSVVADGTYNMRFKLYATSTGGTALWTETCTSTNRVTIASGLFSHYLGSMTSLSDFDFNQTLWLGVEIGGTGDSPIWDGEMTPRKKLGAVPASFESDKLDGLDSSQFLRSDAADTMNASSSDTLLTVQQDGSGNILDLRTAVSSKFIVDNNGNVGIGTTTPSAKLQVQDGSVLFSGATGTTPISGGGTRLMWIPSKYAFRAGYVESTEWDDENIGNYSIAMGYSTVAGGIGSTAMGGETFTEGAYSTAMGNMTYAGGIGSTAMGFGTGAIGDYSTAIGWGIGAVGDFSVAIGLDGSIEPGTVFVSQENTMAIMGGKLGIGTVGPTSLLEISADDANPTLTITNASTTADYNPTLAFRKGTSDKWKIYLDDADGDKLKIATGTADIMTMLESGRVGIGTSTPVGDAVLTVTGGTTGVYGYGVGTSGLWTGMAHGYLGKVDKDNTVAYGVYGLAVEDESFPSSAYGVYGEGMTAGIYGKGGTGVGGVGLAGKFEGELRIQGTSTTPLFNVMTSSTASALYVSNIGSVGIGTTTPQAKLQVAGHIYPDDTTGTLYNLGSATYKWANLYAATTTVGDIVFSNEFRIVEAISSPDSLIFLNQNKERIAELDETGNLWVRKLTVEENTDGQILNLSSGELKTGLASLGLIISENGSLEVQRLKTQELCVGEICINESQLRILLNNAGIISSNPAAPTEGTRDEEKIDEDCDCGIAACDASKNLTGECQNTCIDGICQTCIPICICIDGFVDCDGDGSGTDVNGCETQGQCLIPDADPDMANTTEEE